MKKLFILCAVLLISTAGYNQTTNNPTDCLNKVNLPESISSAGVKVDFPCEVDEYSFTVFDEMGHAVYSSDNQELVWKGENNNGSIVKDGTYFWTVKFNEKEDEVRKSGKFTFVK